MSTQHADLCSGAIFINGGFSSKHFSMTCVQRGAKGQLFGSTNKFGGAPGMEFNR
jgi:hypothetical protein